jgi:hypothetical protein
MGDQPVWVGPGACNVQPLTVTIGPWDHIIWRAKSSSNTLLIVFPRNKFPAGVSTPPFENMLVSGNNFSVSCSKDMCTSGPVSQALPHTGSYEYRYNQILNGVSCDGRMIIKW